MTFDEDAVTFDAVEVRLQPETASQTPAAQLAMTFDEVIEVTFDSWLEGNSDQPRRG